MECEEFDEKILKTISSIECIVKKSIDFFLFRPNVHLSGISNMRSKKKKASSKLAIDASGSVG